MKDTNKNHKNIILITSLFMIALVAGLSLYDYTNSSKKIVETRLKEITKENNSIQKSIIEDKLAYTLQSLHSFSIIASDYDDLSNPKLLKLLKENSDEGKYLRMSISLKDGTTYSSDGVVYNCSERTYFKENMKGNDYISNILTSLVDGKKIICISTPIFRDNVAIGALHNTIASSELKSMLKLQVLSKDVPSNLIQSDGAALTSEAYWKQDDYFKHLNIEMGQTETSTSLIQKDFISRTTGSREITVDGNSNYIFYTPIENTDWNLVTYLSNQLIRKDLSENLTTTANLARRIGCLAIIISLYIIISNYKANKKIKYIYSERDAVIANSPGCMIRFTLDNLSSFEYVNDEFFQLSGYTRKEVNELFKNDYRKLILDEDLSSFNNSSLNDCQIGQTYTYSYRIQHKNGTPLWVYENRHLVEESNGEIWFYITLIDINELKQTQQKLKISEERYQMIINQTESVVFDWDISSDVIVFSPLWESKYGYKQTFHNFLQILSTITANDSVIGLLNSIIKGDKRGICEYPMPLPNGEFHWCKICAQSILDSDGYLLSIFGSIEDIDDNKRKTIALEEKSKHDGMTKVLNKTAIEAAIGQALLVKPEMQHLLIVLDIDNFKEINDTYGHSFGDHVLMEISSKVRSCFRQHDYIGRIGGDEFIIFMNSLDTLSDEFIQNKLDSLLTCFDSIQFDEYPDFHVTCSIGSAIYPLHGTTYNELFKSADDALYSVKRKSKDGYALYSHDI